MFDRKRLMICLAGLMTISFVTSARGDLIVVPNANSMVEGNARLNTAPFNNPSRYQQIFDASQFNNSFTPILITQIAFRPDVNQASAFSNSLSQLQLDLSTTTTTVTSLNSTFANNLGSNNTTVFNGGITLSSANLPGPGNTKLFDIVITFTTPFLYDPTAGNLLLDIRNFGLGFTGFVDAQGDSLGTATRLVFLDNDPNGTSGSVQAGGAVVQFAALAVPSPSGITLVLLAILSGVVFQACRRGRIAVSTMK